MTTHDYTDDLLDCEKVLDASAESLILRQATRQAWDDVNKVPTEPAFGPENSQRRPSFSQGVSAQDARDWHQKHARSPSLGVWAVATLDVYGQGLRVVDDSDCPDPENERAPGHCYVDYRGVPRPTKKAIQAYLTLKAVTRGELATDDIGHHSVSQPT